MLVLALKSESFYQFPSFEDPRIGGVEARLNQQPLLKEKLSKLFSTPLSAVEPQVAALRTEDIVPFLDSLTRGKLPTRRTSQGNSQFFKGGGEGWYYTTPNYSHSYFDQNPHLRRKKFIDNKLPLWQIARMQHHTYINVARVNAFVHTVEPHLVSNWWRHANDFLKTTDPDGERQQIQALVNSRESVRENFCSFLFEELEAVLRLKGDQALSHIAKLPIVETLLKMLASQSDQLKNLLIAHLAIAAISRMGIQIGFTEKLLEGKRVATDGQPISGVIHEAMEMAVHAPHGVANPLEAIAYIQPMGLYEKELLEQLGILSASTTQEAR